MNWFDPHSLLDFLGTFAVVGVAVLIFIETATIIGSILPGDSLLFLLGMTLATKITWFPLPIAMLAVLLGAIIGAELVRKTFWFFASVFIFVVATNWFGLLPGVGTIGYGFAGEHGFHVTDPLLRGANADFNMTFAMSMVFFVLWTVWALQANGPIGFLKHIFGAKGGLGGFMGIVLMVVFFAVGHPFIVPFECIT
jgi:F-type H+-transporting ATPase subunit a